MSTSYKWFKIQIFYRQLVWLCLSIFSLQPDVTVERFWCDCVQRHMFTCMFTTTLNLRLVCATDLKIGLYVPNLTIICLLQSIRLVSLVLFVSHKSYPQTQYIDPMCNGLVLAHRLRRWPNITISQPRMNVSCLWIKLTCDEYRYSSRVLD